MFPLNPGLLSGCNSKSIYDAVRGVTDNQKNRIYFREVLIVAISFVYHTILPMSPVRVVPLLAPANDPDLPRLPIR